MSATPSRHSRNIGLDLRRSFALSALLALTLFQVTAAGHQFQHQGGDLLEVCGICMQLDRMDDALSPDEPILLAALPALYFVTHPQHVAATQFAVAYQSRAPPTV